MSILNALFGSKSKSAHVAKERLQIILAREKKNHDAPDFLPALQNELIAVVAKYVCISEDSIKVSLEKQGNFEVIEVNVVLSETVRDRSPCDV